MKLVGITCPHCGAKLEVTSNSKMVTCDYCNSDFMIDDEIKRIRLDDAEQAGYEFERGRQRAILEAEQASVKAMCTHCGGSVIVDNRNQYSTCPYCNKRTATRFLMLLMLLPFTTSLSYVRRKK